MFSRALLSASFSPLLLWAAAGTWAFPAAAAPPAPHDNPVATAPPDTLLATLAVWADDVWLDILDREGTFHGPLAAEGIFQRFHPEMDEEYALDVRTGLFTVPEEAAWARSGHGIRAAGSSISHPAILNRMDWRQGFLIAGPVELTADYRRDHSLTDRRDYPRLGVRWREIGGSAWVVWARLGVHFFKPAADAEIGAGRSWPAGEEGTWRVEFRLAALDAFSDAIFVGLGVDPEEVEGHLDHAGVPLAARAVVERRGTWWRLEAHGGGTTLRQARVTFPATGEDPFELAEEVRFVGGLVEIAPASRLRVAGYGRFARAESRHTRDLDGSRDLRVAERTAAVGFYARHHLTDMLSTGAELHGVWRPESRREGNSRIRHEDQEVYGAAFLQRRPVQGWVWRLAYAVLSREAGVLLPDVDDRNHRLITEAGIRTDAGFEVIAGLRWDLDELGSNTFDGGQLRLRAQVPGGR